MPDGGGVADVTGGTVAWDQPLSLCSVNLHGTSLTAAVRTKRRITLPQRNYRNLLAATLSAPLENVVVETGVLASEQLLVTSTAATFDWTADARSLTAEVRHDFGTLGTLVESYRVVRLFARIDPLVSTGELTFTWRRGSDVSLLVPCDGFDDHPFVSAVLRLEGPDAGPTASVLTAYRRNPETQVENMRVPLASSLLLGGEAPEQVDAVGWSANTYAAQATDVQDNSVIEFDRDLRQWRRHFAADAPLRASTRPVRAALSDVGSNALGQAVGKVTIDWRKPDGTTTSMDYRAAAFRRIDKRSTALEFADRCAPIDNVITFWVGAVGPPDRRLLVMACKKFGAPFQKNIVVIIPLHWRTSPALVGVARRDIDLGGIISDPTGVSLNLGPERVRIEPKDQDRYQVTLYDSGGTVVHAGLETLETPLEPVRTRVRYLGHANGMQVRVELSVIDSAVGGPVLAPEKLVLVRPQGADVVVDWTRLAFTGTPGVDSRVVATTADGRRVTWASTTSAGITTRTLRIDAADGTPLVPTTQLIDD